MQDLLDFIKDRRTIRKYKNEQIKDEELNKILEAGLYAPSAGGRQSPKFIVIQDKEITTTLGVINRNAFGNAIADEKNYVSKIQVSIADSNDIKSAFYNAPTVIVLCAPKEWSYGVQDSAMAACNMGLMAWDLGIGTCFITRAEETFSTDYGKELLKKLCLEDYTPRAFLTLGYPEGEIGQGKPRKQDRIIKV